MESRTSTRLVEIDFFRGLVLLFILVDHISGTILGRWTFCNFAIADAAEIFVFLAGFVTAAAYERIREKTSTRAADLRFYRRAIEIYFAYLLVALLMLVCGMCLYLLDLETPALDLTEALDFLDSPESFLHEVLLLKRQPYFSDILPMYAIFAVFAPVLLRLVQRSLSSVLIVSLGLWLVAPWLAPLLPTLEGGHWTFNPFAWQLVFVLGLIFGAQPELPTRLPPALSRSLTIFSLVYSSAGALFMFLRSRPEWFPDLMSTWRAEWGLIASKQHASSLRVASFLAIIWLVYRLYNTARGSAGLRVLAKRASLVTAVGRNSLDCFVATAVLSILAEGFIFAFEEVIPDGVRSLLGDLIAVTLLLTFAAWIDARRSEKRGPPRPPLRTTEAEWAQVVPVTTSNSNSFITTPLPS